MNENIDDHILKRYEIVSRIGRGAYGIVWKARELKTKKIVALKKVFDAFNNPTDAQRTYREVTFLKCLKHANIVNLIETYPADNKNDLYMIFEYMDTDLHVAIRAKILQPVHRRYIVYQLFKALKYIHSAGMIHRDLKPANILLDSECRIKLADFGLARMVGSHDSDILTDYVATRWFRAPEILIGSKSYSFGVDLWSIGCMMGEMILGKALFSGTSTINQLEKIVEVLGSPNSQQIQSLGGQNQIFSNLARHKPKLSQSLECDLDELDLISKLLQYDPSKRINVADALRHPYLKEFHVSKEEPSFKGNIVMQLQDDKQYSVSAYRDLLYKRMDYSKILKLVNQQKKLLEEVATKKTKQNSKYIQSYMSQQYTKSNLLKSNSTMVLEKSHNLGSALKQSQSQQSQVKNKLKFICQSTYGQQQDIRLRSGLSKQSSNSKQKILNNVTNTSLSPNHKINQRNALNILFQK